VVEAIATDLSYTLSRHELTSYFRAHYRILKRLDHRLTEWLVGLPRNNILFGILEYIAEGLILKHHLPGNSSPLVPVSALEDVHRRYYTGVFSREPRRRVEESLIRHNYRPHIDVVVAREDVGFGVLRKKHIDECVRRLGATPSSIVVVSDSPADLEKGRILGTVTCGVLTGYHSERAIRMVNPDFVFSSLEEFIYSKLL